MPTNQEERLRRLRRKLEALDSHEIRAMLEQNRIRGAERRAVAEDVLSARKGAEEAPRAAAGPAEEEIEEEVVEPAEIPVARRVGRILGIAVALGSLAFLIIRLVRR